MGLGVAVTRVPVRKIRRTWRGNRGRLGAPKAGGRAEFESTLERDFYLMLEFDPTVARFTPQPIRLTYRGLSGRKKPYVPDTLVEYHRGRLPCLYEVKYVSDLRDDRDEYRLKFRAAREQARDLGWTFCTATERSIRGQVLKNIMFLRPFRDSNQVHSGEHLSIVLAWFARPSTPRALLEDRSLAERGVLLPVLWTLVARGALRFDLGQPLTLDSPLSVDSGLVVKL